MNNGTLEREADEIEHGILFPAAKMFLVLMGLVLFMVPMLDASMTYARAWQALGAWCIILAAFWKFKEKRVVTARGELDSFLIDAAKRLAHVGSITRLVEEYRARGADELSLARLRGAPRLLRERADDKLSLGLMVSGAGFFLLLNAILMLIWKGEAHVSLANYAVLGAGVGAAHIAQGIRLKWYARQFTLSRSRSSGSDP